MAEYLGKMQESTAKFPQTNIWMDSCGEEELNYGLERGITGATSNPIIVGAVIKKELAVWGPRIRELADEMPEATEEEIVWRLIDEIGSLRAKKLLPIYRDTKGKRGRLSIQTNAKFYRSPEKMLEQAKHLNALGENMQVKLPAGAAGIAAMEEATYQGISINATVSFSVAQAVAVAEAVERGLARRTAEGKEIETMSPVCTLMIGRTDDWLKERVKETGQIVEPECLEWGGVAVIKRAYRIYRERGYRTRLLSAANRNVYHWSELLGGELSQTINYGWYTRLDHCDTEVKSRIEIPVKEEYLTELRKIDEFAQVYEEDGMRPEEFVTCRGFRNTIAGFIGGYDELCQLIRNMMIG